MENIKKTLGGNEILKGISFSMEKGSVISIIGSSGSGKTTLMRSLSLVDMPTEGKILVNGEVIFDSGDPKTQKERDLRRKRLHFGFVFQQFNLFPQYTALKNVMLAPSLMAKEQPDYKARRSEIKAQIREEAVALLTRVGLADKLDLYPYQLSGGQQQRVAIARALAMHPDILCFDEPTSALDPELTGEVLRVITELSEQDATMLIVTHEIAFARDVSDKIIFLDDGKIMDMGTPAEVIDNPEKERMKQFLARYFEG